MAAIIVRLDMSAAARRLIFSPGAGGCSCESSLASAIKAMSSRTWAVLYDTIAFRVCDLRFNLGQTCVHLVTSLASSGSTLSTKPTPASVVAAEGRRP